MGLLSILINYWKDKKKEYFFNYICKNNNLNLDFILNKNSLDILEEIFIKRIYSLYFPFKEKSIIVDIGSHKGYFSIFASKNSDNNSRIISFEIEENNYLISKKNISFNNINNIEVYNIGIFSNIGKTKYYTSLNDKNHSLFSEYNSLLLNKNNLSNKEIDFINLEELFKKYNINKIDFLKLDCEGSEFPILFSTDKKILDKINTISMEFHDLNNEAYTGLKMINFLEKNEFDIKLFKYEKTFINNNFGQIIAVKKNSLY